MYFILSKISFFFQTTIQVCIYNIYLVPEQNITEINVESNYFSPYNKVYH